MDSLDAIRKGDTAMLSRLLTEDPALVTARIDNGRSLLHIATDWPGQLPNVAATIRLLVGAGADVNVRAENMRHRETPLHWAASSGDVEALDALLDCGADLEADGGCIGNGTPLADAVAFGQWKAAQKLIERGARANLWQAAGLGLMGRVEGFFAGSGETVSAADIDSAFWCACHGGQQPAAAYLLSRGANPNWRGYDQLTPLGAAMRSKAGDVVEWLRGVGAVQ